MEYLNKFLSCVEKNSLLLKSKEINFILGLNNSLVQNLKKEAIKENLITINKNEATLTIKGQNYLKENPIKNWKTEEYPQRPEINLELLKLSKASPVVTKAIRNLAKHLLENAELKENSYEFYIYQEILNKNEECKKFIKDFELEILNSNKIKLSDIFDKYNNIGLTNSIIAIFLLKILAENKNIIAIYEKNMFQLNLNQLMFDRMYFCPQNFEIQKTLISNNNLLKEISKILLNKESSNILEITKGLIRFIKKLDKYTLQTNYLNKNTYRFRNIILNAKDPINLFFKDIPKVLCNKNLEDCDEEFVRKFKKSIKELDLAIIKMNEEINSFFYESFRAKNRKNIILRFKKIKEYISEKDLLILYNNILDDKCSEEQWFAKIATCINQYRVPKDWSDNDLSDYKFKTKELALKFLAKEAVVSDTNITPSKTCDDILKKIIKLTNAEKNMILRKIVNG